MQCAGNDDWNSLAKDKQNEIKARQGVRYPNTEGAIVMDPETMKPAPKENSLFTLPHLLDLVLEKVKEFSKGLGIQMRKRPFRTG